MKNLKVVNQYIVYDLRDPQLLLECENDRWYLIDCIMYGGNVTRFIEISKESAKKLLSECDK